MTWKVYQARIAEFFRRAPDAVVEEDVEIIGKSGTPRQLDVLVKVPIRIKFGRAIEVPVDVVIIVDAKEHERPVAIGLIGQIDDLRDDVGAHLAIIASPIGFTKGALNRCKHVSVFPLTVTSDLLFLLYGKRVPQDLACLAGCDPDKGKVKWGRAIRLLRPPGLDFVEEDKGNCVNCGKLHVTCPDCAAVYAVTDAELNRPLKCPGNCGRVTIYYSPERFDINTVQSYDLLDCWILEEANSKANKRLSYTAIKKLIKQTKWQYFAAEEWPTISLTEEALMEWQKDALALTPDGITVVEKVLSKARYLWLKPALIPLTLRQEEPSEDDGVEDNTGSE